MAVFQYEALNKQGNKVKGIIDANGIREARNSLKDKGLFPTTVKESNQKQERTGWNVNVSLKGAKVGSAQLAISTRQLSTLISAGMPLVDALKALVEQTEHPKLKSVIAQVADQVNEGSNFADSLAEHSKVFPRLYINMIASGEASGTLDLVLVRLSDLLEAQVALKRKVVSALIYPILMIALCFIVVAILLAYVVPQITKIFADKGLTLPLPTQIIIHLSDMFKSPIFWIILIGLTALSIFSFKAINNTENGRFKIDQLKFKIPLFGNLLHKFACTRFSRNLSTMLESGIEVLTALGIAKKIVGNAVIERAIESSIEGVREGQSLALELERSKAFPKLIIHMCAIGEKTGELPEMLNRAANSFESELDAFVSGLTSILEPILIIFLAVIVGGILASVMLPMLEMTTGSGI